MGVVEMTIDSLRRNLLSDEWSLILKEKGGQNAISLST